MRPSEPAPAPAPVGQEAVAPAPGPAPAVNPDAVVLPWEHRGDSPAAPNSQAQPVETATVQKSGGFPAILFIIIILLILVGIGIFLFTQQALPFQ
jgi:hypothetical protein